MGQKGRGGEMKREGEIEVQRRKCTCERRER